MRISLLFLACGMVWAQTPAGAPTLQDMFTRNVGTREMQDTAFTPHKVIGNLYYVGTQSLGTFLITTPQGHILINTSYERTVPVIRGSVEKLGFKFSDVKIVLGSHAHGDHMEGDALAKELTGAQVMAMAEDVPALERMRPGGKAHPIDRMLHDGDTVTLGGVTLTARLTPGHTKGCTTWTTKITEDGKTYDVVIVGSIGMNPGARPDATTIAEYQRSFQILRSLKVDVPLAPHPAMYKMDEKYARIGKGPNPFVDPGGFIAELDLVEGLFQRTLREQAAAPNAQK
jgi:metallo-beta-lactamase class B